MNTKRSTKKVRRIKMIAASVRLARECADMYRYGKSAGHFVLQTTISKDGIHNVLFRKHRMNKKRTSHAYEALERSQPSYFQILCSATNNEFWIK